VSLSVECSSSDRHYLLHVDDIGAQVLKAV
jgi:hypothetical protein